VHGFGRVLLEGRGPNQVFHPQAEQLLEGAGERWGLLRSEWFGGTGFSARGQRQRGV
jgi:hypothetical protein